MRLTVQPTFSPTTVQGSCYLCKLSPRKVGFDGGREQVLDTGVDIAFEGTLAFCAHCVEEMGRLMGMAPMSEHAAEVAELVAQRHQADETAAEAITEAEAAEARAVQAEQAYALAVRLTPPAPAEAPKPKATPKAKAAATA